MPALRALTSAALCAAALLSLPARAATEYSVSWDPGLFGNLDQDDTTACGDFACGPTAAVNSFVFLQNQAPGLYGNRLVPDGNGNGFDYPDLVAAADALSSADFMGCTICDGGTDITKFISGKKAWVNKLAPGSTIFGSRRNPSWEWIYKEIKNGEDVELLFGFYDTEGERVGGHYVTLTGFDWTDTDGDSVVDADEGATIGFIDPQTGAFDETGIFQTLAGGPIGSSFGTGGDVTRSAIDWAVKESPVPEPQAWALLLAGFGVTGLLLVRRRRRSPN